MDWITDNWYVLLPFALALLGAIALNTRGTKTDDKIYYRLVEIVESMGITLPPFVPRRPDNGSKKAEKND
jgi:hypothetical protein